MGSLTELQKKQLVDRCNSINVNTLLKYIQSGEITLAELANLSADRREYIDKKIKDQPNPLEQEEWNEIISLIESSGASDELMHKFNAYIKKWEEKRPTGNHVDEAVQKRQELEQVLIEIKRNQEEADWQQVDPFNKSDLLGHLKKYPNTIHAAEIEESLWGLTDKENINALHEYQSLYPEGKFAGEVKNMLESFVEWDSVRATRDVFKVNSYLKEHSNSPFAKQAQLLVAELKQEEIGFMRNNPNGYESVRLMRLLSEGIVSEYELINARAITENILNTIRDIDIVRDLPDVEFAIANSTPECKEGYTDVYFFGIPSTGKTCVLMGLSRSDNLHINLASGGGEYASTLQQYIDVGKTIPRTPGDFVTTLEATISSLASGGLVHKINLVEMSGEEFAFGVANNPDHVFTFEEMGTGVTKLLCNDNRKVFFLVIDPTANVVKIRRTVLRGYDEATGQAIEDEQIGIVNQRTTIQKMVNILQNPDNAEIMKKVDSLHIIMTKSDILGNPVVREEKALKIFQDRYANNILEPLINLCKEYNINAQYDFHPNLYTFSLGDFYVGGLYEYESTDSNRLVNAIRNSTQAERKMTFWDKVKKTFN